MRHHFARLEFRLVLVLVTASFNETSCLSNYTNTFALSSKELFFRSVVNLRGQLNFRARAGLRNGQPQKNY